ncbi:hypothetical protein [Nocardia africana]
MSTQTRENTAAIEHLDHRPTCEGKQHGNGPRPTAEFWVDIHGCLDKFACAACVNSDRRWFAMRDGATCQCCGRYFRTFEEAETVVPL